MNIIWHIDANYTVCVNEGLYSLKQNSIFDYNLYILLFNLDTRSVWKVSGLPLYLRAGVILHHRAGGILQSNPHLIE